MSGSGISWAICKSAPRSRQIGPNHASTSLLKFFYRPDALPAAQPTASKHWENVNVKYNIFHLFSASLDTNLCSNVVVENVNVVMRFIGTAARLSGTARMTSAAGLRASLCRWNVVPGARLITRPRTPALTSRIYSQVSAMPDAV